LTGLLNSKNSLFETTCMWQNISVLTIYCTAKNRSAEYIFTTGRESSRGTVREMPDKSLRRRCKLEMRRTIKSYTYVRCNVSLNGHRLARWSTWLRRLFLLFLFLFRCPNHLCHRAVFTTLSRSSSLPWCSVVSPVKSPSPVRIPLVNIPRDHVVFFFLYRGLLYQGAAIEINSITVELLIITFCVSRRWRKMYCGHARLCVCLCVSVSGRMPTVLHGPGCNLGAW